MRWGHGVLVLFAIIMIGVLINEGTPQNNSTPDDVPSIQRLFPNIAQPEQITGMELTISDIGMQVAIVVEEDQETWRLRDAPFTTVDATFSSEARYGLGLFESLPPFDRGENPPEAFGFLPDARYVVRFQLEDGEVISLHVGDVASSTQTYYVAFSPQATQVYRIPTRTLDTFVSLILSAVNTENVPN